MTVEPLDPHVMAALRGTAYRVWSEYLSCVDGFQEVLDKFLSDTGKTGEFNPASSYRDAGTPYMYRLPRLPYGTDCERNDALTPCIPNCGPPVRL